MSTTKNWKWYDVCNDYSLSERTQPTDLNEYSFNSTPYGNFYFHKKQKETHYFFGLKSEYYKN